MNVKLTLQFDGTNYCGWQIQKNAPSVQGILMDAVGDIVGREYTITGCSRTDSGVHAREYVCNFHADENLTVPLERLPYAINSHLPKDIICKNAEEVPSGFSANRSATGKRYIYRIDNGTFPDAFALRYAWHCKYQLDTDKMKRAAQYFIGTHDFLSFAASGFSVKTTVRTIKAFDISRDGNIITLDITGNGFLYNMVRIIAGTVMQVGSGMTDAEAIPGIILALDRGAAGITAPPQGLFLWEVFF